MIDDDDVRKMCQRNLVSDSFDRFLDNKIGLKSKDRKQKKTNCQRNDSNEKDDLRIWNFPQIIKSITIIDAI